MNEIKKEKSNAESLKLLQLISIIICTICLLFSGAGFLLLNISDLPEAAADLLDALLTIELISWFLQAALFGASLIFQTIDLILIKKSGKKITGHLIILFVFIAMSALNYFFIYGLFYKAF